jgi:hypothetical chaperone protein
MLESTGSLYSTGEVPMIIGMDFGTTNTRAAHYDGREIHLLPLDPTNRSPHISRTAIYITQSKAYYLGSSALQLYFQQNVGRPTRFRKIWVGEIMQVFAELPTFFRDVYVYEDEFSPGRLFLSIKTGLRNPTYFGTVFQDNWYSSSDLAAIFLLGMKRQMEEHLGRELPEIVLGRPVHFSDDPTEDKIAQSRLLHAAFKAGFEKVYLEYEPVAAALAYERTITHKELVLVFDFGGGTLDFTVMVVGDPRQRRVLATGGIPVAGDVFDQRLFRAAIPKHLGEGDFFISGGSRYPIPAHIFDMLTTPQEVVSLNTPQNLEMLRSIHSGAILKHKTHALLRLVSSNYALLMFDLIEKSKRELSNKVDTEFLMQGEDFRIQDTLTRLRFERAIHKEFEAVRAGLEAVLRDAGVQPKNIDRVIRTGGSSQIPLFGKLLNRMFGYGKVQEIDVFSSVTSGLAIRGREIEQGLHSMPAYTPANLALAEEKAPNQTATSAIEQIDLDQVLKRMEVSQELLMGAKDLPEYLLLAVGESGPVAVDVPALPESGKDGALSLSFPNQAVRGVPPVNMASYTTSERCALLVTNHFRLINVPLNALYATQEIEAVRELLRLEPDETATAGAAWDPENPPQRWLGMVTRFGQARCFDAHLVAEQVVKKPYFQLDKRYLGSPIGLVFMEDSQILTAGSNQGRAAWASRKDMGVTIFALLKTRKEESIRTCAALPAGELLVAVSAGGMGLPFKPAAAGAGSAVLRRNFDLAGFMPFPASSAHDALALTSRGRLLRITAAALARAVSAAEPARLIKLDSDERISAVLETNNEISG